MNGLKEASMGQLAGIKVGVYFFSQAINAEEEEEGELYY